MILTCTARLWGQGGFRVCGWMRVSRIQCVGLIHCLGAGACVAERIHSPFLSLFPSVAEHMDSMKLLRVLLSLSSSQSLCLSLCLTMSVSEFQQRKDFFLLFFYRGFKQTCVWETECASMCKHLFLFWFGLGFLGLLFCCCYLFQYSCLYIFVMV